MVIEGLVSQVNLLCNECIVLCAGNYDLYAMEGLVLQQVREEATGRVYKVFNEKEDANEEEVSWCSTTILGRYEEEI